MSHSDHVRGRALTFGHDHVLLHTRARLLEADGYRTDVVLDLQEVLETVVRFPGYDILVLCHSVTAEERGAIEARVERMPSPVPTYAMNSADSPETFTRMVARLTGKQRILGQA